MALVRLLIALLFLLWPLLEASEASPAQTRQEASGVFQEARKYEQQGDLRKAEEFYLEFLRLAPGSAVGHTNLGVVYAHEQKVDKAIAEYKQALLIDPSLQPVYTNLGIACFKSGRFAEAVKPLEKALSFDPHNAQVRQLLGITYSQVDRYDAAIGMLTPLASGGDPSVLFALGACYEKLGKLDQAQEAFKTLLTSEPNSPRAHFVLGEVYFGLNQFPQGAAEFERVYALDPNWPQIHLLLGAANAKLGHFEEAEKDLRFELHEHPESFAANFTLGALLSKQGKYDEAIQLLERAKKARGGSADTLSELARAYWKKGLMDEAAKNARAAVAANPKDRTAHFLLAQIAQKNGDKVTARQEFAIAASLSEEESGHDVLRFAEESQKSPK